MIKLYSLDVFDTLLLRNDKSEPRRFFEIAEATSVFLKHKGVDVSQNDLFLARYIATETSYRFSKKVHGCREGSLEEIYRGIFSILHISASLCEEALALEIEYEKQNVTFNETLWNKIKKNAKENKAKIILISDTYMHAKYIKNLLDHHKPRISKEYDKLYSSADYTVSKASGHLFDFASRDFRVVPNDCMHMGDNLFADFQKPKMLGWQANFIPVLKERENKIKKCFLTFRNDLLAGNIIIAQIEKAARGMLK